MGINIYIFLFILLNHDFSKSLSYAVLEVYNIVGIPTGHSM